ncbi:hypothetical protein HQ487_02685 [Candidatus Uhrbacteria bacterium]|nr:hypothetical protein [Candidatus Uhrbacteria bacterium]
MIESPRDLLTRTFTLYRANFWLFIGYAAWLLLPLASTLILTSLPEHFIIEILVVVSILAQMFISIWMGISIMQSIVQLEKSEPTDPNEISKKALLRIRPVLIAALLQGLIIFGGLLLLIVPAIIFWVWYAHSQISVAVDGKRPMEALAYSRELVTGRFFPALWRLVSGPVVIGLGYAFILGIILTLVGTILGTDLSVVFSEKPPLWTELLESMADIFIIPLFIIYSVLLYENLKKTLIKPDLEKDAVVE